MVSSVLYANPPLQYNQNSLFNILFISLLSSQMPKDANVKVMTYYLMTY